ncbi:hypothetical protein SS45_20020 [Enterobacter hormaechei subsp. steigerwaltii]|uniref:hypothetical protein n=1 Tax=Enterobacter cloacae complex TaxID=354276 RepID=UPI0005F01495|nr:MULTISPECIES: hypothetical protein [Enterobacter cloacae complex]KJN40182.1 hypothetical protein SS45_20020 [Enterobacter hormaechei subsp. steigerwaltii]MCU3473492.1 hypothetical protein [Enterobacter hormaechei subsp. steigerwaltii]HAY4303596.1 hypothetical protein [Escherichia coli]
MNIELAAYMCVVYYPFMILVVVKKRKLIYYLYLALSILIGALFSLIVYKINLESLSLLQSIFVGYAVALFPTFLLIVVTNIFLKNQPK